MSVSGPRRTLVKPYCGTNQVGISLLVDAIHRRNRVTSTDGTYQVQISLKGAEFLGSKVLGKDGCSKVFDIRNTKGRP